MHGRRVFAFLYSWERLPAAISSVSQIAMIAAARDELGRVKSRSHLLTFSTSHLLPDVLCLLPSVFCPLSSDF
jgi:hypothetical protein